MEDKIVELIQKYWNNKQSKVMLVVFMVIWLVIYKMLMSFSIELIGFLGIPHNFLIQYSNEIKIGILILGELLLIAYWFYIRIVPGFGVDQAGVLLVSNISDSGTLNEIIDRITKDLQGKLGTDASIKTLKSEYHYNLMLDLNSNISAKKETPRQLELFAKNIRYIIIFESGVRNKGELIEIKNIKQIVLHRPTHESNSNLLRSDLMFALGSNIDIPLKNERDEIDTLIKDLSPCIKYIASVVDFLGGKNYENCRTRLIDMINNQELNLMGKKRNQLTTKINLLIGKTYEEELNMIISGFHETGEYPENRLKELIACNDTGTTYFASCALRLQKAILYFLLEWNTQNARKNISKAKGMSGNDQSWKVSLIFLDLWDGDYSQAIDNIKGLKFFPSDKNFGENIELFNNGILKKFPDRIDLVFWNAIISKKIIKNTEKFNSYKKTFLESPKINTLLKESINKL